MHALAQALMAGVRIGGAEVAAQAIESGMPVTLKMHVDSSDPRVTGVRDTARLTAACVFGAIPRPRTESNRGVRWATCWPRCS